MLFDGPSEYYDENRFIWQNDAARHLRPKNVGVRLFARGGLSLYKPGEKDYTTFLMQPNYRFQLLAPAQTPGGWALSRSRTNEQLYRQYLTSMQTLRGRVYLKDGAIQPWELDEQGRFPMRGDEQNWHFLLIDDKEQTIGCARYLVHPNTVAFENLRIAHSPAVRLPHWGEKIRSAVEADLKRAQAENLSYVEVGGWALCEKWRGTRAALEILVASFALGQLWGGALGSCMATARHHSCSILRRIGGSSFSVDGQTIPPYDDPNYGCMMELLRFDSHSPAKRFASIINQLRLKVAKTSVIRGIKKQAWGTRHSEAVPELLPWMQMASVSC